MKYLHTMVRVTDVEASLRFYRDGLGLEEVRRTDNEKGRYTLIFLAPPGPAGCAGGTHLSTGTRRSIPAGAISATSPMRSTTSTPSAST